MDHDPGAGRFYEREYIPPLGIYCEDADFSGAVYHANYVRYLKRGRSESMRTVGASLTDMLRVPQPFTFMV